MASQGQPSHRKVPPSQPNQEASSSPRRMALRAPEGLAGRGVRVVSFGGFVSLVEGPARVVRERWHGSPSIKPRPAPFASLPCWGWTLGFPPRQGSSRPRFRGLYNHGDADVTFSRQPQTPQISLGPNHSHTGSHRSPPRGKNEPLGSPDPPCHWRLGRPR